MSSLHQPPLTGNPPDPAELAAANENLARAIARWQAAGGNGPGDGPRLFTADVPAVPVGTGPIPWPDFCRELLALYEKPLRAASTRRGMAFCLRITGEVGKVKTTADLTIGLLGRLVADRTPGRSANSVRGFLRYLACACSFAVKAGYLPAGNPFSFRPLKSWVRPSRPRNEVFLTAPEVRRLLDLLAEDVRVSTGYSQWRRRRLQAIVNLICACGLRKMEALTMHAIDLDLEARMVRLVDRSSEGGYRLKTFRSGDAIPLPEFVIPVLTSWKEHRLDAAPTVIREASVFLFPNTFRETPYLGGCNGNKPLDVLKKAAARVNIQTISWQILPRTCATAINQHASPGQAQQIMRHTSQATTMAFYVKRDMDALKEAVREFRY